MTPPTWTEVVAGEELPEALVATTVKAVVAAMVALVVATDVSAGHPVGEGDAVQWKPVMAGSPPLQDAVRPTRPPPVGSDDWSGVILQPVGTPVGGPPTLPEQTTVTLPFELVAVKLAQAGSEYVIEAPLAGAVPPSSVAPSNATVKAVVLRRDSNVISCTFTVGNLNVTD
jgi:hypothetical protein